MDTTVILKTPLADCWLDGHILYIMPNKVERTSTNIKQHYTIVKGIAKDKFAILIDMDICQQFEKKVRNYIDKELPTICKALAIITKRPCEKMVANYFRPLEKKGIPVELFDDEKEARAWLRSILEKTTPSAIDLNTKSDEFK